MWYVYVMKSEKPSSRALGRGKGQQTLYIGSTNDLKRRFEQHRKGYVKSTKHRRPWKLIYYEAHLAETAVREREKKLKQFGAAYQELKKRVPEMN